LIALIESASLPHTVLTVLPEIYGDDTEAILLGTLGVATDNQ